MDSKQIKSFFTELSGLPPSQVRLLDRLVVVLGAVAAVSLFAARLVFRLCASLELSWVVLVSPLALLVLILGLGWLRLRGSGH